MNSSLRFAVQIMVVSYLGSVLCQSIRTGAGNESATLSPTQFNETSVTDAPNAAVPKMSPALAKALDQLNSSVSQVNNAKNGSADELILIKNVTTGMDCILLKMDAKFTFNYDGKSSEFQDTSDVVFKGPIEYVGHCGDSDVPTAIVIMFENHFVKFKFDKNMTSKMWYVKTIEFASHRGTDPNSVEKRKPLVAVSKPNDIVIAAPFGKSYQCSYPFPVKLHVENSSTYVFAIFENIQIEGYANSNGKFGPESQCSYISDTVPIAVGCTLAIVTILIVGAYGIYRSLFVKKVDYDTMED